jgi:hypothetical protein
VTPSKAVATKRGKRASAPIVMQCVRSSEGALTFTSAGAAECKSVVAEVANRMVLSDEARDYKAMCQGPPTSAPRFAARSPSTSHGIASDGNRVISTKGLGSCSTRFKAWPTRRTLRSCD